MMYKKKKSKKTLILFVLFLIISATMGFAALSKTLNINGIGRVVKQSWNIHFENVVVSDFSNTVVENSRAQIDEDNNCLVTYNITLGVPGDSYEFTVDVVNEGAEDAMLDVISSKYNDMEIQNDTLPYYLEYSATYADNVSIARYHKLSAGSSEKLKIRISYNKNMTKEQLNSMTSGVSASFSFKLSYVKTDENAITRVYRDPKMKILSNINNVEQVNISTTDHENELRFIGANPNNYVIFNDEASCDANQENCSNIKWRIIGIFDGKLKLIRESIGEYSYDTSAHSVNDGYGINQWGESRFTDGRIYYGADLMRLLNPDFEYNIDTQCKTQVVYDNSTYLYNCNNNSANDYNYDVYVNNSLYWNGETGNCYNNSNYNTTSCSFDGQSGHVKGLTDTTSREMIDNATWYFGTHYIYNDPWTSLNANNAYTWERQNTYLAKQCSNDNSCSDTISRTATWTGKVGLMYLSDFIYATSGGNSSSTDTARTSCLTSQAGYTHNNENPNWGNTYTNCLTNDWITYDTSSTTYFSLVPRATGGDASTMFGINRNNYIAHYNAAHRYGIKPTIYLKSNVIITKGNGTATSPYVLSMV